MNRICSSKRVLIDSQISLSGSQYMPNSTLPTSIGVTFVNVIFSAPCLTIKIVSDGLDSNAGVDFSMNLSTAGSSPGDDGPLPNGRMRVPRPPRLPQSPHQSRLGPISIFRILNVHAPALDPDRVATRHTHPTASAVHITMFLNYLRLWRTLLGRSIDPCSILTAEPMGCVGAHLPEGCPLTAEAVGWEYHRYDPICFKFSLSSRASATS